MTKAELIDHVHDNLGDKLTKKAASSAVQAIFDVLSTGLSKDGRIAYPDFGTFTVKERAARTGLNPQTREKMQIPASKTVHFKPAPNFKGSL